MKLPFRVFSESARSNGEIEPTAPSGARLPRRIWMWPLCWIGSFQGRITPWPGARSGASRRFSARVLPVTVMQSPCSTPWRNSMRSSAGVPPISNKSCIT